MYICMWVVNASLKEGTTYLQAQEFVGLHPQTAHDIIDQLSTLDRQSRTLSYT